jgi:hypothetical protein
VLSAVRSGGVTRLRRHVQTSGSPNAAPLSSSGWSTMTIVPLPTRPKSHLIWAMRDES